MPKRKTASSKAVKAKVQKEDESLIDNVLIQKEDESLIDKVKVQKEDESLKDKEDENEEKLNEFKRKFGMVKGDDNNSSNWINGDSYLIYNPSGLEASAKIAAFDVDGTLIDTKSGKKFPKTWDDFKIMLNEIPGKLKTLKSEGYELVIFTNQAGFTSGHVKEKDFKKKMTVLLEKLGVSMQIFIAIDKNFTYRKPNTGLFELLESKYNSDVKIDMDASFYVGDAAGRPDDWAPKKKKDFSCSDRLFAMNCGLKFYTPEEYFLDEKPAPFNLPTFNPKESCDSDNKMSITSEKLKTTTSSLSEVLPTDSSELTLIIMVGSPGSGKSHFCQEHLVPLGYNVINRDTLKTWQKCVAETERLFKEKKNVVVDNTNPDKSSRERYIECALKAEVKNVLCFVMDVDIDHSRHNGKFREITDDKHEAVSEMVFRLHNSKYEAPTIGEKFTDICKIVPQLSFKSEDQRSLYRKYLNDK